jgi:hypothetical protein
MKRNTPLYAALDLHTRQSVLGSVDHQGKTQPRVRFATQADALRVYVGRLRQSKRPLYPDAPDAFRFAVPSKLAGILENAGAKNVIERRLNFELKAPISFEQFWQLRTEMSGTLREKMAGIAPAQLPTIKQAVADAAGRYFRRGTMSFPAEALILSGRKSAI